MTKRAREIAHLLHAESTSARLCVRRLRKEKMRDKKQKKKKENGKKLRQFTAGENQTSLGVSFDDRESRCKIATQYSDSTVVVVVVVTLRAAAAAAATAVALMQRDREHVRMYNAVPENKVALVRPRLKTPNDRTSRPPQENDIECVSRERISKRNDGVAQRAVSFEIKSQRRVFRIRDRSNGCVFSLFLSSTEFFSG